MAFLNQVFSFFNNNNNNKKKPEEKSTTTPPINEDKNKLENTSSETTTTTTPSTSYVSTKKAPTPAPAPPLPEVEFEQSRNLLQLDFFCQSNEDQEQLDIVSFPKFDYLLKKNVAIDDDTPHKKPHRKLSTTLRHRISLYRPNHNRIVQRTVSTPDLYNSSKN